MAHSCPATRVLVSAPCHAHAKLPHCCSLLSLAAGENSLPWGVAQHHQGGRSQGWQEAARRRHPPCAPTLGQRRHSLAEEGGSFLAMVSSGLVLCCWPVSSSASKLSLPLVLAGLCTSFPKHMLHQHPSAPTSVSLLGPTRSLPSWGAAAGSPVYLPGQRQAGEFWQ